MIAGQHGTADSPHFYFEVGHEKRFSETINTGFIAGVNTLDFVVNNGGPGINPTGVRVELSGTANRQPPP